VLLIRDEQLAALRASVEAVARCAELGKGGRGSSSRSPSRARPSMGSPCSGSRRSRRVEDGVVNLSNDQAEIAPIEILRDGPAFDPSAQWTAQLSILNGHHARARIFRARATGAAEEVGPTAGATYALPDLNFSSRTLGIEANTYATGPAWNGEVTVRLTVTAPTPTDNTLAAFAGAPVSYDEDAVFRVAPWMIASHLVNAERLYAVDLGVADQAAFKADMTAAAGNAGIPLTLHDRGDDKWMQDCMEFGQHRAPHAAFRVVLRGAGTPSA
jgi:hypothetical protein